MQESPKESAALALAPASPAVRAGRLLSCILHPLAVGTPVAIWVGVRQFGGFGPEVFELMGWVGFLGLLFPLGLLYLLQRLGRISDFFITQREERRWLYPIGIADLCLIYGLFRLYGASAPILAAVAAAIAASFFMGLANLRVKASIHCAGNAGVVLALCWVEGWRFWSLWLLVVLTIWARWAAREHTAGEIAVGLLLGIVPTVICMLVFLGAPAW